MKPVETQLFEFLEAAVEAAVEGEVLFGVQVHDTVWQTIKKTGDAVHDRGIRISEASSDLLPLNGCFKEVNAHLTIVCFVRVAGKDKTERLSATEALFELQHAVMRLLWDESTFDDRVVDSYMQRADRGYDVFDGDVYAVANIPITINPDEGDGQVL